MMLFFFSFVSKKDVRHGYRGLEAMHFLLNMHKIYPIFILYFHLKQFYFPIYMYMYIICQKWLDTLQLPYDHDHDGPHLLLNIVSNQIHML